MGYNSNGILTAPFTKIGVSQGDLEKALGVSTIKDHIRLFDETDINIWSKHKPFEPLQGNPVVYETDAARDADAKAACFGLHIPLFNPGQDFHTNWQTGWTYVRPTSVRRVLDFKNYASKTYLYSKWPLNEETNGILFAALGVAVMGFDPAKVVNGSNAFPWYVNLHESDGYLLAPSDFNGCTANGEAVQGWRVDLSKMHFGIAVISTGSYTNDRVWISSKSLNTTSVIGDHAEGLTVSSLGTYSLVPILAVMDDTRFCDSWQQLIGANISQLCSIDGRSVSIKIVDSTSVYYTRIAGGYLYSSESSATTTNFRVEIENRERTGFSVYWARCYVIAADTYTNPTYRTTINELVSDAGSGGDPQADVYYGSGSSRVKIATYHSLRADTGTPDTIGTGGDSRSYPFSISAKSDEVGSPYDIRVYVLLVMKYQMSGSAQTIEAFPCYYQISRDGHATIITSQ